MRVLIEPSTFDCLNMGDVAMLQVAVRRLRFHWPHARISVLTADPAALRRHCPDAHPVPVGGRDLWFEDRYFLGSVHRMLPRVWSRSLIGLRAACGERYPRQTAAIMKLKPGVDRLSKAKIADFVEVASNCDLVLMSGSGTLNDIFIGQALRSLKTLSYAVTRGAIGAMVGQGIGPVTDPQLKRALRGVVPRLSLVSLRESLAGPRCLSEWDDCREGWMVTGDEAIEAAYEDRPTTMGGAVGVNLRVAAHTGVGHDCVAPLAHALARLAEGLRTTLKPVPIAIHRFSRDHEILRELLARAGGAPSSDPDLETPEAVIRQVGRCRVVVTGAYHAAVFALSQGVPVVALIHSQNSYYRLKFAGLGVLFPGGCVPVEIDLPTFQESLLTEARRLWDAAPALRAVLRDAAAKQIRLGRGAYAQLARRLVDSAPARAPATEPRLVPEATMASFPDVS